MHAPMLLTCVVLLVAGSVVATGVIMGSSPSGESGRLTPDREFSVSEWNSDAWNRHSMVGDLVKRYRLVGMNRQEVRALLGRADSLRWSELHPTVGYRVGNPRGGENDTPLLLHYDDLWNVVRVEVPALNIDVRQSGTVESDRGP